MRTFQTLTRHFYRLSRPNSETQGRTTHNSNSLITVTCITIKNNRMVLLTRFFVSFPWSFSIMVPSGLFTPSWRLLFDISPKELNWQQALERCNRSGGTLAKITREGLRSTFSNLLEEIRRFKPYYNSFSIGLLSKDEWTWIDDSPLNSSLWKPGYPKTIEKTRSCGYLAAGSSRIKSDTCTINSYPLCQKKAGEFLWSAP